VEITEYAHAMGDAEGRVAFGVREDGSVEVHGATIEQAPESAGYAYAVADAAGRVAFGVRTDGTVEIEGARAGAPRVATKRSPISLTLSDGTGTDTRSAVHVRYPFAPTVDAVIRSVHIQNIKDRNGRKFPGALSVNGVWFGAHDTGVAGLTGKFKTTPTQVSGAFTTPADGGEYVVSGLNIPVKGNTDYLLSLGYTCADGQSNAANMGTSWTTSTPGDASVVNPTGMVQAQTGMFEVWIEIEHTAPVGAYLGDSIWCGARNTHPVYTAPGVLHARANGIVPMLYCQSGAMMSSWAGGATLPQYAKWAALSKPDFVVWELGRNDLIVATDVGEMRTRFDALYPYVVAQISPNIYMTTVTPKSDDETSTDGVVRRAWNDVIRKELAGNQVRMFFDTARAVERAGGTNIDPDVSADGLHFTTQGSMRLAQAINQPLTR
jgi:hypothetical protein